MINRNYILYIEDDEIDAIRFSSILKKLNFKEQVIIQPNGLDGIEWLHENQNLLPKIIVLDLNMPKMCGFEFLNFIKKEEAFKKIPVIILTSSENKADIQNSFKNQVAGYMVKPASSKKYQEVVSLVKEYWDNSVTSHF